MSSLFPLRRVTALAVIGFLAFFSVLSTVAHADSDTDPMLTSSMGSGQPNSGQPNSSIVTKDKNGNIVQYGNDAILYKSPSQITGTSAEQLRRLGAALYMQNCASCHGTKADGVLESGTTGSFPSLIGLGPATIDFWISTGRMPAADTTLVQANRKPPRLTREQGLAIAEWVNSLSPAYPLVPEVNTADGNSADGFSLYALNCAACHTITGGGNALAYGTYAPSLHLASATEVVEAIRTGPGNMPNFAGSLSDEQVRDITRYVTENIQNPENPGGLGLGGLGPVAEGFIGLALGVGLLMLAAFWVGDRQ